MTSLSAYPEVEEDDEEDDQEAGEKEIYIGNGEDLVLDNGLLKKFNLHINTARRFVSCRLCGYILTGSWENHVQGHHVKGQPKIIITDEERQQVRDLLGEPGPVTHFEHGMEAVQGIAISKGYACQHCTFCGVSKHALQSHASKVGHQTVQFEPCKIQRPYPIGLGNVNYRVSGTPLTVPPCSFSWHFRVLSLIHSLSFSLQLSFVCLLSFFASSSILLFLSLLSLCFLCAGDRDPRESCSPRRSCQPG